MIKQAYKTTANGRLYMYISEPEREPTGVVLCIHGGGWRAETPARLFAHADYFASLGGVGISVGYRLIDDSGDVRRCLADCADALMFARDRYKGLPVTVFGDSAGGYLAACLGCEKIGKRVRGDFVRADFVVDCNGIENLTGKWSYAIDDKTLAKTFSPLYTVSASDAPVLLLHGDKDTTVDPQDSADYCAALKKAGVDAQLILLPGAAHAFILFDYRHDNAFVRSVLHGIGEKLRARKLV